MIKQLKIYYIFVALPFALLLIGSAVFLDAIKSTIRTNPHPQINYTIFTVILIGGVLIILNARRLLRQAKALVEFSGAIHAKTAKVTLQEMSSSYTGALACVLQMLAASGGRSISHQEQVALEHELANAKTGLIRRNALPQYLTGLLVGMGLLGTFIGLLATLNDITLLITSFADLDMATASPLVVFRTMIERMKAPMQSMAIAFSASMFGLLGSIILGLMMVGIRRLQGDMFSLLSSEIARHIEVALSFESVSPTRGEVATGDLSSKILQRIEERLAEAARVRQQALSAEIDDFKQQRADMLRTLTEQTEASNNFRGELQQFGSQLGTICNVMEKGNGELATQISGLTVHMAGDAKQSHEQRVEISAQINELLVHINAGSDKSHEQRAAMLRTLAEQTEASHNSRSELQQLGKKLTALSNVIEKGKGEISTQIIELIVYMAGDAKESHEQRAEISAQINELLVHMNAGSEESHKLLAMLVDEQQGEKRPSVGGQK